MPDNIHAKVTGMDVVTPNWFSVMHVPLVRERPFSQIDRRDGPRVDLINESATMTFFGADRVASDHQRLSPTQG